MGTGSMKLIKFPFLNKVRMGTSRTATLGIWEADFDLFRTKTDKVPWESVLKGEEVQEGQTYFKK